MKCIVTAGPTYEELDHVRRLTNFSTGRLGSELANFLVAQGHHVHLLRGHYSVWQGGQHAQQIQMFTTTADLTQRLQALSDDAPLALFHAAAVSDFTFGTVWTRLASGQLQPLNSAKIPTRGDPLLVELKPTPKVISQLRNWFPRALIVGWKFELDGDREDVIGKATVQIAQNRTDACVANGRAYGQGFGLVRPPPMPTQHFNAMQELFAALQQCIQTKYSP